MLALTRRKGEEVVIGDPRNPLGVIRVVDVHGDKVKLAFDFPRDTQVNRRELAEEKAKGITPSQRAPRPRGSADSRPVDHHPRSNSANGNASSEG